MDGEKHRRAAMQRKRYQQSVGKRSNEYPFHLFLILYYYYLMVKGGPPLAQLTFTYFTGDTFGLGMYPLYGSNTTINTSQPDLWIVQLLTKTGPPD
jgi:hypothetical protein